MVINIPLAITGAIILVFVYSDFIYTSLSTSGSGFLSKRVTQLLWKCLSWLSQGPGRHLIRNYSGMVSILVLLSVWLTLTWLGNGLIFCADPDSIRVTGTDAPVGVVEKFYFAGYTLATLGNGDLYPARPFWRIFTVIVALSGFSLLTIAITYLIQVLTSEIEKRKLSLYIASIGTTPQDILMNGWDGKTFRRLESHFISLSPMILSHSQHHLAYPILHQFTSHRALDATAFTLTVLDEALTILYLYIPEEKRPDEIILRPVREALTNYLLTIEHDFIRPATRPLDVPAVDRLFQSSIPMLSDRIGKPELWDRLSRRRSLLKAMLNNNGWYWKDLNERTDMEGMESDD